MYWKILSIAIPLILLSGCSIPEFYLDIHYPTLVNVNESLPIDVFVTNARIGTVVHIESIQLTGELAQNSKLVPGRNGLYSKPLGSEVIFSEPNRRLTQFETGNFSVTLKPVKPGIFHSTFIFVVNGNQIDRDIAVEVK